MNQKITYAMIVSYRGPCFPGGFEPGHNVPAIRQVLSDRVEEALLLQMPIDRRPRVVVAGRTDLGVSAKANLFSFKTINKKIKDEALFVQTINQNRNDMVVSSVSVVDSSFHAKFSARQREYLYVLPLDPENGSVDEWVSLANVMNELTQPVLGKEVDYFATSYGRINTQTSLCVVEEASCWLYDANGEAMVRAIQQQQHQQQEGNVVEGFGEAWKRHSAGDPFNHCLVFKIRSNRFLRRMIRKMVTLLLQEASNVDPDAPTLEWNSRWVHRLESRDRCNIKSAPALGLCMWRVICE